VRPGAGDPGGPGARTAAANRAFSARDAATTSACATPEARRIEQGRISMYGPRFAGRTTASGERYEPDALTMAHRTLPFGTLVRVTNTENGRSVEVRVNDRGPFVAGRIADVSPAAARILGMVADGVVNGSIEVLAPPAID
jgi:rare lipoprotein A